MSDAIKAAALARVLQRTADAALEQGLSTNVQTQHEEWKPDAVEPDAMAALVAAGPSAPRAKVEEERDDTGHATSREFYRDSISFSQYVQSTPNPTQWYELARFIVRRGEVGVIRLLWTWLDLIGSWTAPNFLPAGMQLQQWPQYINLKTAPVTYTLTLPGTGSGYYSPMLLTLQLAINVGVLIGNCRIRLGTTPGGNEIFDDRQLVGFIIVGSTFAIPLAGLIPPIVDNANLYLTVTQADTSAPGVTGWAQASIWGNVQTSGVIVPFASGSPCGIDPVGPRRQGVDVLWTLRFEQLRGRAMPWTVPVIHTSPPPAWEVAVPGLPWPNIVDWPDDRYAWGTPGGNVFIVVPEDTIARLCLHMSEPDARAFMGWCGGRLQGYIQPANSPAAVHNVRHGWNW